VSKFIVIEGLIGVGKTSLCKILRDEWGAELILEPSEANPFLANFYADPGRFAFPTQMFYLATRYAQQTQLHQTNLFKSLFVADYLFAKDQLFAKQTLSGHELDLYFRFSRLMTELVVWLDLILFLDAPTSVIQGRIAKRAISSEQVIQPDYLNALRRRYYGLWETYDQAPIYVIETTEWNYVSDPDGRRRMLELIQGYMDGKPVEGAPRAFKGLKNSQFQLFEDR
jgi:deoxyadenosine/deoxycytidine kinase